MTKFLVTGVSGLLGLNFALAMDGKKHQVIGVANTKPMQWVNFKYQQVELTKPGVIDAMVENHKPDVILHCAAIANMETCESDPVLAAEVNGALPGRIAESALKHSIKMVHISTDAVFDGAKGDYHEEDTPNPLSVYASTKLAGEEAVSQANPEALIARVNFYGWSASGTRSLGEMFAYGLETGKVLKGFTDVLFCPMMVLDLISLLVECAEKSLKGLYHMTGNKVMSKYQFGVAIAEKFGYDPTLITPTSVLEGKLTAARSPNLGMNTEKLITALGHNLPTFEAGMQKFYDQYRRGFPQYIKTLA